MLNKETKSKIIKNFAKSENDTGSSQVQVAILSERINQISEHLKKFPKDKHSRLGLIKIVGKRRVFLNYLKKSDLDGYKDLVKGLKDKKYLK